VLTAIGVLVGGYLGGVDSPRAIFVVVLSTAVGMGVSGFYGSYLVERAERGRAMRELEESTLSSLEDTTIAAASRYATIVIALVDGASPFVAAMIVMIPFLFTGVISMHAAYFAAVGVGLVELFFLGVFLGAISRERLWLSGLRLAAAGVIALVISLLLGGGIG
jgi:predicted membrane protein (TIGR00267 family)